MSLRACTRLLYLLATMTVCATFLHANELSESMQISGSMPLAGVSVTENGPNLLAATAVMGTNSLTSGAGSGDFSIVPMMTSFGPFRDGHNGLNRGGFSISNAGYGGFVATGGSIRRDGECFGG